MDKNQTNREVDRRQPNDRQMFIGLLALLSLALPAVAIRSLLPDLNPIVLAGTGLALYAAYLAWLYRMHLAQSTEEQSSLETVVVTGKQDQRPGQQGDRS